MAYPSRLEAGPWFSVGEQLDGPAANQRVLALRDGSAQRPRPYVVYVHVPFCESICSFCALYTFGLRNRTDARLDQYLDAVLCSLEQNPWYRAAEPPTTVHFGGGTPLVLGMPRFERLVRGLIDAFGTSPACEWAVETTTSALDARTVDALEALNFQRILRRWDMARRKRDKYKTKPQLLEELTQLRKRVAELEARQVEDPAGDNGAVGNSGSSGELMPLDQLAENLRAALQELIPDCVDIRLTAEERLGMIQTQPEVAEQLVVNLYLTRSRPRHR